MVVMASGRLRGRGFDSRFGTFFFHSFFFCLIFSPLFFLHARSAISMLEHFSSILPIYIYYLWPHSGVMELYILPVASFWGSISSSSHSIAAAYGYWHKETAPVNNNNNNNIILSATTKA